MMYLLLSCCTALSLVTALGRTPDACSALSESDSDDSDDALALLQRSATEVHLPLSSCTAQMGCMTWDFTEGDTPGTCTA
eukprot:3285570-Amphidinium_carterae.1